MNAKRDEFDYIEPREKIEVHLSNGKVISGPRGATLEEFMMLLDESGLALETASDLTEAADKVVAAARRRKRPSAKRS